MFSTFGTMVANAVILLSPAETVAASTALIFLLGGLAALAWLTSEPVAAQAPKPESRSSFRKAA